MERRFELGPMDRTIGVMTAVVLALPAVFLGVAAVTPETRVVMMGTSVAMAALYGAVWVWARPSAFVVDEGELRLVYPGWTRSIPRSALRSAEVLTQAQFRERYGFGMRVGVGGLWGGFGLLVTGEGTLDMAISRVDELVVVHAEGRRDLLLTPADTEGFVRALT